MNKLQTTALFIILFIIGVFSVKTLAFAQATPTPACSVTPTSTNTVTMTISVPETQTYTVWSRMLAPDSSNNAFYLQIDGGCATVVGNSSTIPANEFTWVNYRNASTANLITVALTAGTHVIKLTERDPGVGIDKILLTDTTCVPTGNGANCEAAQSTPTPTPNPLTATIQTSPASSSLTVGTPFTVDISINGGGKAFNAAQASVTVSSNLSISGISAPTTDACNFTYVGNTPNTTSPSFAGAMLGTSSNQCTVYRMSLTPLTEGTGTITLTDGSVKSFTDNSEILLSVNNGTYAINAAAPTATPVPGEPTATSVPPTATPLPTAVPTVEPTAIPTAIPTVAPTAIPSGSPTPTTVPLTPPTIGSVTSPTYNASIIIAGSRPATLTKIYINNLTDTVSYANSTSWQKTLDLNLGNNDIEVFGEDSLGNRTTATSGSIIRHKLSDINGDNAINLTDISLFAFDWLKTSNLTNRLSDMNDDGLVNLTDFSIIAKQYGQ
ncbi:MAG: dockerin type I domain-containing protein [Patescibacteria group bacterium]